MKKIIVVFMAALALTLLASCGDGETTTLVIYSDFGREVVEKELYQSEIFDAFEEAHNVDIQFETLAQAEDTYNKIDTEQQADNFTIDLLISHFGTMADYINEGYVQDVNDLEDEMSDRTFLSTFDGSTNSGNTRYFFPINSDVYLAYANKDAFDSLPTGLTEEDILAGDYTWEDYIDWAAEIGANSVHMKALPLKMLTYQIGGMALSNGGSYPNMNDAGNLKAWQDVIAMKDYIHPESATTSDSATLMGNESVMLSFELMAPLATAYAAAPAKYEVFPGPMGTSGKAGSIIGGHGIGIVNGAPHQEMAEEFIKWFTAPEQIVDAALGTIPTIEEATTALTDDPEDLVIKKGLETVKNANVEGLQMISDYTSWSEVKAVYDSVYTGIMDGSITLTNLQSVLDTKQADLEALLVE
jgi:multiple sugar transport system substrate-binding protein